MAVLICITFSSSNCRIPTEPTFPIKVVNLGGWLVTEGWIKPSLFDGIPNKDLLDGTGLQFKSVTTGKYLCAERGGGTIIVANRTAPSGWETFKLWRINETTFNFRVFNNQFVGLDSQGNGDDVVAVSNSPGISETFQIVKDPINSNLVRIKASNGLFLQARNCHLVLVTADHPEETGWGNHDPSVFVLTNSSVMQGEFQVTNGYGPERAPQVMRDHWETFIVEEDFKWMSENGLDGVRIPVGWWIASDPTPPLPYVGGSLQALDNAFLWAQKYGLKVIIDLHAAPGSQNVYDHSSSRDGSIEWGSTNSNIQQTFSLFGRDLKNNIYPNRYARIPSLYAVELLNEPQAPGVSLESLESYYSAGYKAVRRHSSTAFVILSNRLSLSDSRELLPLASGLSGSVIDVHYYNLFSNDFNGMTVQQNIDAVYNRTVDLNKITTSNGPLTFVGEWVAEWKVKGAKAEDYQRFASAQQKVYGRATFGWAYWTLKNVNNHWSLKWMINNGYIKL
ncbi:hypothetical protein SAY87_024447 [Trapa incisa]|uniref:Mannan endo-1,4-beta-mannosidase n=1 Tax=Trapa incisa TaxID=236973 RepID=A0AAN7JF52_9MYRT|nr:hypothetical protein SAY87_024447 [Trapa incisa]